MPQPRGLRLEQESGLPADFPVKKGYADNNGRSGASKISSRLTPENGRNALPGRPALEIR